MHSCLTNSFSARGCEGFLRIWSQTNVSHHDTYIRSRHRETSSNIRSCASYSKPFTPDKFPSAYDLQKGSLTPRISGQQKAQPFVGPAACACYVFLSQFSALGNYRSQRADMRKHMRVGSSAIYGENHTVFSR